MTVGKTKKADLIICNHLAVKSSIVTIAIPASLHPAYKEGLLMGFVDGTHNYRIWDTKSNSVITLRDVVFTHHSPTTIDIAPDVGPEIVQVPGDDIIETTEMPVSPQRQLLRQFSRIDQQETLRIPDNIDDDDPPNLQVVPRSPDMRVVGARWVFTRKIDGETGKPSVQSSMGCQRIQSNRGN